LEPSQASELYGVAAFAVGAMTSLYYKSPCTYTNRTTDRTSTLLISSNVHYVHLDGDN